MLVFGVCLKDSPSPSIFLLAKYLLPSPHRHPYHDIALKNLPLSDSAPVRMSGIAHHLVRRGLEATQHKYSQASVDITDNGKDGQINFPVWGFVLIWATFLMFVFVQFVVSRSLVKVIRSTTNLVA